MASLGVLGDPDGWLHAGGTMSSVIQQLEGELSDADGSGGTGLRPHWYGPVADAYQDAWQQRRSRYDDLIGHAKPGITAISDFAARMIDFQRTALNLEQKWLGTGLVLTADGLRFTLPAHHASLSQDLKQGIELLGESERDVAEMWRDIDGAVQDLDTALRSAASVLEDFGLLGVPEVAFLVSWAQTGAGKLSRDLADGALDGIHEFSKGMHDIAKKYGEDVDELKQMFDDDPDLGIQARLSSLERTAARVTVIGDKYAGVAKYGGWVLLGVGAAVTWQETRESIHKDGVERGIEEHIGDWTALATGPETGILVGGAIAGGALALGLGAVAAGSALGAAAVVVGVGALTAVACVGVGWVVQHATQHVADFVQHEVDAHGAAVVQAGEAVVHDAAHAVGAGVKDLESLL